MVFIQRQFEGVTAQMSRSLSKELRLVLHQMDDAPSQIAAQDGVAETLAELEIELRFDDAPDPNDQRRWFDFSGTVVTVSYTPLTLPTKSRVTIPGASL